MDRWYALFTDPSLEYGQIVKPQSGRFLTDQRFDVIRALDAPVRQEIEWNGMKEKQLRECEARIAQLEAALRGVMDIIGSECDCIYSDKSNPTQCPCKQARTASETACEHRWAGGDLCVKCGAAGPMETACEPHKDAKGINYTGPCVYAPHVRKCVATTKGYIVTYKNGDKIGAYLCDEAAAELAANHTVADIIVDTTTSTVKGDAGG